MLPHLWIRTSKNSYSHAHEKLDHWWSGEGHLGRLLGATASYFPCRVLFFETLNKLLKLKTLLHKWHQQTQAITILSHPSFICPQSVICVFALLMQSMCESCWQTSCYFSLTIFANFLSTLLAKAIVPPHFRQLWKKIRQRKEKQLPSIINPMSPSCCAQNCSNYFMIGREKEPNMEACNCSTMLKDVSLICVHWLCRPVYNTTT